MEPADALTPSLSLVNSPPAQKRRKLRKGTQSCWECKRRKARCTFSVATQDICEGCKRRGTDCVSQEITDQPPPPGSNRHIVDRLGQVEALVGRLLKATHSNRHIEERLLSRARVETQSWSHRDELSRSGSPVVLSGTITYTPASSNADLHSQNAYSGLETEIYTQKSISGINVPQTNVPFGEDTSPPGTHDALSQGLIAAWPSQKDLDVILDIPIGPSQQIIKAVLCDRTDLIGTTLLSSRDLLQSPSLGSHPVLIARQLLVLATYLQGMPSSSAHHLEKLGTSSQEIMSRAVKTAHNLVTCNDELVASIEGIECIMLEGLYENYAGDLRRSWLAARRAVMIAQMLGLNRGVKPTSLVSSDIEPDDVWYRLVQLDRYLSLMLGLPQSSVQDFFAHPETLESCTPSDRMRRLCTVACGHLIQRGPTEMYDPNTTKEIDKLLQGASESMPAQWWLIPVLSSNATQLERIQDSIRFNDHLMYYHLLLQLYFPYILHSETGREYDHHKMTVVTASRDILSRFMFFRTFQPARYYCRGVDLMTFLSSTALCLAHISCDQRPSTADDTGFHFLAHQRLSDRGMLEQTLTVMQGLIRVNNDAIGTLVATLLKHILIIEENIASGAKYTVTSTPQSRKDEGLGYQVTSTNNDTVLNIFIPHFSVIKIELQGSGQEKLQTNVPKLPREGSLPPMESEGNELGSISSSSSPRPILRATNSDLEEPQEQRNECDDPPIIDQNAIGDDWELEGLDFNFLDGFVPGNFD